MLEQCNLVVDYSFSPLQEQKCMAAANMTIKDIVYVKSFCASAQWLFNILGYFFKIGGINGRDENKEVLATRVTQKVLR